MRCHLRAGRGRGPRGSDAMTTTVTTSPSCSAVIRRSVVRGLHFLSKFLSLHLGPVRPPLGSQQVGTARACRQVRILDGIPRQPASARSRGQRRGRSRA